MNAQPQFLVPGAAHDVPMTVGPAIHVDLTILSTQEGPAAAIERMSAIVAAIADHLTWDQQQRLGVQIGFEHTPEPHPGPIPADKVQP